MKMAVWAKRCPYTVMVMLLISISGHAQAAEETDKQGRQQQRMTVCNADAKNQGVGGDERRAFMSGCLTQSGMNPQERMKSCNAKASEKKLDSKLRTAFMSGCLQKK
ncbi:PsiF family protein [Granulibacter bethesdensis]|uniref:Phosphate starvation-induced protein psiF n=2 Tax=Granulibacter bethesdensis TaxID=364410 RepID=Q0BS74_GRABC|nr:PsiF family protein [Granulibacter bethesdensis]ABI62328.1 Phosphate starvation-induced protein psiF [Granulibacter bethesdensis CGDNIH1]AHJ63316.1 Phosphate starvation-induced protein psiF [Granulibacter bethesdensis]AHJ66108.1 Phosphate starvation-induced protein psiF [Granulibacter bethesdensis CGDNIH4]AHJ68756.1 Phosphate starvation-induced protein psiF [Granulibacter bethesdensis]APH52155.1 Phosphate starvation-induced protein psiF [Granulibacter bethesdensis]